MSERWDGSSWTVQAMPSVSGYNTLLGVSCTSATACVTVGYDYDINKQVFVTLAEAWDGTTWSVQKTPNHAGTGTVLQAVSCTFAAACTAVGYWRDSTGNQKALAERWDGSAWSLQTTPGIAGTDVSLQSVSCTSATACTAVGSFRNRGGTLVTLAEAWDGSSWTLQTTNNPNGNGKLSSVSCIAASSCFAAGETAGATADLTLVERWNGTKWSVMSTPNPAGATQSYLQAISCASTTACTAAGYYVNGNGASLTLEEEWTGGAWQVIATPNPAGSSDAELSGLSCATATQCSAAGYYVDANGVTDTLALGGGSWMIVASPNPSGASSTILNGVSCTSAKACMAVGDSFDNGGVEQALAERWGDAKWAFSAIPTPTGVVADALHGVACTSATACTAVGSYLDSGGGAGTLVERWNGSGWAQQPSVNPGGSSSSILLGVSCASSSACMAVGDYHTSGGQAVAFAESWNGNGWTLQTGAAPSGAQQSYLLAVSCAVTNACTAVGSYTDSSGSQLALVEYWNGGGWVQVPATTPFGGTGVTFQGVSCTLSKVCMAVGYYDNFGTSENLAEEWHGGGWAIEPTPAGGRQGSALTGVSCTSMTQCTAVGYGIDNTGADITSAIGWDGSTWTYQPTPLRQGSQQSFLNDVSCVSTTACFAVGSSTGGDGVQRSLIER